MERRGSPSGFISKVKHSGYSSDDESDGAESEEEHQNQPAERELSAEERAYEQVCVVFIIMLSCLQLNVSPDH